MLRQRTLYRELQGASGLIRLCQTVPSPRASAKSSDLCFLADSGSGVWETMVPILAPCRTCALSDLGQAIHLLWALFSSSVKWSRWKQTPIWCLLCLYYCKWHDRQAGSKVWANSPFMPRGQQPCPGNLDSQRSRSREFSDLGIKSPCIHLKSSLGFFSELLPRAEQGRWCWRCHSPETQGFRF